MVERLSQGKEVRKKQGKRSEDNQRSQDESQGQTKAQTIVENKLERLRIADLKFDEENPNYMTQEQMAALRQSMTDFGFLTPIIVDQNGVITDGQHRVLVYKEFGKEYIDGYRKNLNETQRRLLRQIQNKLRGQHEPEKEYNELLYLLDHAEEIRAASPILEAININRNTLSDLAGLLSIGKQNIMEGRTQDGNPVDHYANSFLYGNIKQITAYFDNQTYEKAIEIMEELKKSLKLETHTDIIWTLINFAYDNPSTRIEPMHTTPPQRQEVQMTYT